MAAPMMPHRGKWDIALTVAPLFGMPPPLCTPLGLAYLNGALRLAGYAPRFRDLAADMFHRDPELHAALFRVAMPEAGGYYGVNLPLLLATLEPSAWPSAPELAARVHQWAHRAATVEPPALALLHVVDANVVASTAYARALKALRPDAVVVAGGPGVRLRHVQQVLLAVNAFDALAVGEGEPLVAPLAEAVRCGDSLEGLVHLGLVLPGTDPQVPALTDVKTLPWPDFTGMSLHGVLPVMASRGCIRDCSFCSERFFWNRFRLRGVDDVVDQIAHHRAHLGPMRVFFHDDLLNANLRWLAKLGDAMLDRLPGLTWDCYMEPARIEVDLARHLRIAGLTYVRLGVEHLDEKMLARMNRAGGLEAVRRAIAALADAEINVFFDLVVGHPGESLEAHEANLRGLEALLAERPNVGVSINPFCLLDGAPAGLEPREFEVEITHLDPDELPSSWSHLRPHAGNFIASHRQDPDPTEVLRRARELEAAIRALGRRTNRTDRDSA